jgi:hypothetical protein
VRAIGTEPSLKGRCKQLSPPPSKNEALLHVFDFLGFAAERLLRQRCFYKLVDITVEHAAGVGRRDAGAQVFHHLIGLQNVGADLPAPSAGPPLHARAGQVHVMGSNLHKGFRWPIVVDCCRHAGAKTRRGTPCQRKVIWGKERCRNRGGMTTGPRTPEGKARIADAQRLRWAVWRANPVAALGAGR